MASSPELVPAIAAAVVAGRIGEQELVDRIVAVVGKRWRWIRPLARRLQAEFGDGPRPRQRRVEEFLRKDASFQRAASRRPVLIAGRRRAEAQMCPAPGAPADCGLPEITTTSQLARWMRLRPKLLLWLADRRDQERRSETIRRRYRYRLLAKGARRFRLIEAPCFRLKEAQQRLLAGLLSHVPPHDAAHGFRAGRSIHSFAAPHVGRQVVLKMDLQDFFPSIGFGRAAGIFRTLGYPDPVADLLAGLATNTAPDACWEEHCRAPLEQRAALRARYGRPHLPQGAPTSPAIANLCAHALDRRLAGLAACCDAAYTRYADDLVFSGDAPFAQRVRRFRHHVAAIALEEGFVVNYHKTRIMRRSVRQRVTGIVVNQRANISGADYDRLKAILHNCRLHGPASQNRHGHSDFRAHLSGRVAWVQSLNPSRGQRLREMLERIAWQPEPGEA